MEQRAQLTKKFPSLYGIRRFISAFIRAPSRAHPELAKSSPQPPILFFRSLLILSSNLRLDSQAPYFLAKIFM